MLSLITVSLLKQVFCFYKFPLHIQWGMGWLGGTQRKEWKKDSRLFKVMSGRLIYTFLHTDTSHCLETNAVS